MATTTKTKTKKLSLLKKGDKFRHITNNGKEITVTAVAPSEQLAARGKPASKNGVVIKARVKTGPNAGKDRLIVHYAFNGGTISHRYADLDEVVTLA